MEENFGSKPEDISVAISAHIRSCCYTVKKDRAVFFKNNFGDDCVHELPETSEAYKNHKKRWNNSVGKLYALSLEKANLNLLIQSGISDENIVILDEKIEPSKTYNLAIATQYVKMGEKRVGRILRGTKVVFSKETIGEAKACRKVKI